MQQMQLVPCCCQIYSKSQSQFLGPLWQCFIIIFYKKRAYVIFRGFDQFGTDSQTECNAAIANSSEVIIQLKVWGPLCPEVKSGMCILHTGLQLLQVFLMMDGIREAEKRNQGFRLLLILPPFPPHLCPEIAPCGAMNQS